RTLQHSSGYFLRDRRRRKSNRRARSSSPRLGRPDPKAQFGCLVDASFMITQSLEKLHKRTLRERIYEEVVHLILSGQLQSGGWGDEKQGIHKVRVSRTPFRE